MLADDGRRGRAPAGRGAGRAPGRPRAAAAAGPRRQGRWPAGTGSRWRRSPTPPGALGERPATSRPRRRAERYRALAETAATPPARTLRLPDGRLRRSWKDGRASADGVLEDHACLAEGLLALYEATFDERWFVAARGLADTILDRFADPAGGFFDTSDRHETLVTRPKDLQDNAVPSGNAMAATVLLGLAALTGEGRYRDAAERALGLVAGVVGRYPSGFAQWLVALDFALAEVVEVAVVGDPADPATARLVRPDPGRLPAAPRRRLRARSTHAARIELLGSRFQLDGRPTAFVCRDFACRQPVVEPEALAAQLID